MQANFEVTGRGPALSPAPWRWCTLCIRPTNPRDTVKWLKERQWAIEGQEEEPQQKNKELSISLEVLAKQNSVMERIKRREEKRVGSERTLQRGAQ